MFVIPFTFTNTVTELFVLFTNWEREAQRMELGYPCQIVPICPSRATARLALVELMH